MSLQIGWTVVTRDGEHLIVGDINKYGGMCTCCDINANIEQVLDENKQPVEVLWEYDGFWCYYCGDLGNIKAKSRTEALEIAKKQKG